MAPCATFDVYVHEYNVHYQVVVLMVGTQDVLQQMVGMAPEVLAASVPGLKARYHPDQFCDTVCACFFRWAFVFL